MGRRVIRTPLKSETDTEPPPALMRIMVPVPRRVGSLLVPFPSRRNVNRQGTLFDPADTSPNKENVNQNLPKDAKNVILFGETGVGKSSLINLLAGERVSATSSAAAGCTLESQRHALTLCGQQYAIWDTAGLDEGTQGSVPAEKAEAYLKQLIQDLAQSGGVDLLMYCVRGTRVRSALLTNYNLFYSAICRKKVPIAIVITGLENQEGNMDTWWQQNKPEFKALKMSFDSHACVTALETFIQNPALEERREMSRVAVIKMITSTCRTQQWKPAERSWLESACSDIHAMLSPKEQYDNPIANIIVCDASQSNADAKEIRKRTISFHNPISLSLSLTAPVSFRSPVSISKDRNAYLPFDEGMKYTPERLFRVYQVPRKQRTAEGMNKDAKAVTIVKRGADLLLFCMRSDDDPADVKSQWEHFNITYGGDLSPQIAVVIGGSDEQSAEEWWKRAMGEAATNRDAHVAYWPSDTADAEEARQRLQHLVNERCMDCRKVTFARGENIFRRSLRLDITNMTTLWTKQESNPKDDHSTDQDLLSRWGVWKDMPDQFLSSPTKERGGR